MLVYCCGRWIQYCDVYYPKKFNCVLGNSYSKGNSTRISTYTNWLGGPENVMPGVLTFRMIVARSVHCDHGLSIFSSARWLSVVNKHCYVSFFIFSSFFLSCTLCSSMPGCAIYFSMACTVMHSLHTNFNVVQQDSMQGHMGHLIITNIAVRNFSDGRVSTDVI